ncbi:N-methylhydantoinase A [Faunimonas pinastri]|uniref:N-methylhydantoinase A n=1 Tax=Faunimonas pinastri TaxID=1855383 RepID=A0A1H9B6V7_9HYPH|nr:hydantoinase/oxoprolinase family protein [Faunimonas pinastri]SEP84413.1 N-methylhydantoinase A [Faunimonas pinastri]
MMVGIDVGGTFTDLVVAHPELGLRFVKSPSTPDDPSRGVLDALELLAADLGRPLGEVLADIELFIHGTTVATNILVQRRGAKLGLITTAGFRDLLELREGSRDNRYALRVAAPEPIIARPLRREIGERTGFDGAALLPLDRDDTRRAIEDLRAAGVNGVVVCLLHAHRNPEHERAVRELIEAAGWSPFVSLSHEILNREGEYDRLSTASVNAYVGPGLQTYLNRLFGRLTEQGIRVPVLVMQSHGGVLPVEDAGRLAVGAVTSGPAGGAKAGAMFARALGLPRLVTYDTGGTTTDVCIVNDGVPAERDRTDLADMRITAPAIEVNPLGIGGGSIAWIDPAGILEIGPQSAGAVPGPACFGKGGTRATLTDANLVLGLLPETGFLGGRFQLDLEQARAAVNRDVAEPLGLSIEEAAWAIHVLASSRITEGIRLATVRRGLDPREFAMMSFGGAGGLHANEVARDLQIPSVIIPRFASVLSALGFLAADVRRDRQRTVNAPINSLSAHDLETIFKDLANEAHAAMSSSVAGQGDGETWTDRVAECRYERQIHTLPIPTKAGDTPFDLERRFTETYGELYQHSHPGEPAIVETCRVSVYSPLPKLDLPRYPVEPGADAARALCGKRRIHIGREVQAPVYRFEYLVAGMTIAGPALIDAASTSVLVLEGSLASIDETGSLRISDQPA